MVNKLVTSIKEKREFSGLPNLFVQKHVTTYLTANKETNKILQENQYNEKSKQYKQTVKEIRAQLRDIYGVFQKATNNKRERLLEKLATTKNNEERSTIIDHLLMSHQSTKERRPHYQELYQTLFAKEPPTHLLDLGCGLNPLAYHYLPNKPIYTCCDISEEDMSLVNKFFQQEGIKGTAVACDLLNEHDRERTLTVPADTVLMLKLVDTLETQQRDITKTIITRLMKNQHVKRVIISFPLKSIGGRGFRKGGKENWFTKFLTQEQLMWTRLELSDEECYTVSRG